MAMTLDELGRTIGAAVHGNGTAEVIGCAAIDDAVADEVTFLANIKYASHLQTTKAAAVLIDGKTACPPHLTRLVCDDPYFAFRNAVIALHGFRKHPAPICAPAKE